MLSLIICSREADISQGLKENIRETIGIQYELIVIDNSKNKYSIFSAYNEGVRRAKYPYLCFMHEDILYHTHDWGGRVINHFKTEKIGIIGVAGGHYLSNTPSTWLSAQINSINILESSWTNGIRTTKHIAELDYLKGLSTEVVAVDGVWFCIPKSLFSTISFDETTFNGFHFYDLDICFQARSVGSKVLVISDILIEHFSSGNFNQIWFENSIIFHNKWKNYLPQIAGVDLTNDEIRIKEESARDRFVLSKEIYKLQAEIIRIRHSKAYMLGKSILKPFSFLRYKIFKK